MHLSRRCRRAGIVLLAASLVAASTPVPGQDPGSGSPATGRLCADYQVVTSVEQPLTPEVLASTRDIVDVRLESFGIPDRVVQTVGSDRITIELADTTESDVLRWLISAPGAAVFLPVPLELQGVLGAGPAPGAMSEVEPLFTGSEVSDAHVAEDESTGEIVVDVELRREGARLFDEFAEEHFGEQFAIVLDDVVQVAPFLLATRFDGRAQISGGTDGFSPEEAAGLAAVLRSGALPARLEELTFGRCDGTAASMPADVPASAVP
jgi:preprotein translocase subunit SecD